MEELRSMRHFDLPEEDARDAAGHKPRTVSMMRSQHLAVIAVWIALNTASVCGAATVSVSGVVRDSSGVPQIGAEVQLLRPDLSLVKSVYTDSEGRFLIVSLIPGRYSFKAMGPSFLPSLRENVRVRNATIVNLTLNTLYEVVQWLPADPRAGDAQKDDWQWTLRSAANRPLLRWLEDGPLVVVSDGAGSKPRLKARLMATGQAGTFGESGERFSSVIEDTPSESRELLARVDFAPGSDAGMESMLGFKQDLGFAGSVESVAAISVGPEVQGLDGRGLEVAAVGSEETMHLGDAIDAEAGAHLVMGRLASSTTTDILPFADVAWHSGDSTLGYRVATMIQQPGSDESEARGFLPEVVIHNGEVAIERGIHQELGWERHSDSTAVGVLVYADKISDPVVEAREHSANSPSLAKSADVLFDPMSGLLRAAGSSFSTTGMQASLERHLSSGNSIRVSYATGGALVMPALPRGVNLNQVIGAARARRAQTCSIALSGTLEGTGTRWRASYSWQPDDTVTAIAPFATDALMPYFNIRLRQPIHLAHDGAGGIEALLDLNNLLAQGYRPYFLSDGSLLIFAQDQRSMRAGLAFTF